MVRVARLHPDRLGEGGLGTVVLATPLPEVPALVKRIGGGKQGDGPFAIGQRLLMFLAAFQDAGAKVVRMRIVWIDLDRSGVVGQGPSSSFQAARMRPRWK